jgi:hypothetical protein
MVGPERKGASVPQTRRAVERLGALGGECQQLVVRGRQVLHDPARTVVLAALRVDHAALGTRVHLLVAQPQAQAGRGARLFELPEQAPILVVHGKSLAALSW